VLSARTDSADKVAALDAGADDYLTKPFGMEKNLARLRAALRRGASPAGEDAPVVVTEACTVDLMTKSVTRDGSVVHLTPTEWGIHEMLARNRGKLVGQKELLQEVRGPAYATETHYLRVYVAQLRRKLEPQPGRPRHLLTEADTGSWPEVSAEPVPRCRRARWSGTAWPPGPRSASRPAGTSAPRPRRCRA